MRPHHVWAGLALLTLGTAVRLVHLEASGVWLDETASVWVLDAEGLGGVVRRAALYQATPPLHYVLAWLVGRVVDSPLLALRLTSALASVLTLLLVARLACRVSSPRAAVVFLALAVLDPRWLEPARSGRVYATGLLMVALAWDLWLTFVRKPGPRTGACLVLAMAGEAMSHIVFLPAVATQATLAAAALWWRRREAPSPAARRAATSGLAALALATLAAVTPVLWLTLLVWERRVAYSWSSGLIFPNLVLRFVPLGDLALCWLIFVLVALLRRDPMPRPRRTSPEALLLMVGGVLLPGLMLLASCRIASSALVVERYWLALSVPSLLLVGYLLDVDVRPRPLLALAVLCVAVLSGARGVVEHFAATGVPLRALGDWRPAIAYLDRELPDGSLLLYRAGFVELGTAIFDEEDTEARSYLAAPLVLSRRVGSVEVAGLDEDWTGRPSEAMRRAVEGARMSGVPVAMASPLLPAALWVGYESWLDELGFERCSSVVLDHDGPGPIEIRIYAAPDCAKLGTAAENESKG